MQEESFSESNLDSAEYRARLSRKLESLIAVLEVAGAKVRQALAGPAPDVDRLVRIQKNLQDTLAVCVRARNALDKRGELPAGLSHDLSQIVDPALLLGPRAAKAAQARRAGAAESSNTNLPRGELNADEKLRFRNLGVIDREMVSRCDIDLLTRQLQV